MGAVEQILRAVDKLERLEATLKSTSERRDPHWKRDYVRLRSDLQNHIVALGQLGDQLTGLDMTVMSELKAAYSQMRAAAAAHQGDWPVVRIDCADPDYLRSLDEMRAIIAHYRAVARRLARDA